jgi:hypothetical protein
MARDNSQGTPDASASIPAETPAWLGEFEPGAFEPGAVDSHAAPEARDPVPAPGLPLWPASEPVTVSYVKPSWDDPWALDDADHGPADAAPPARHSASRRDEGFGSLGLATVTGRRPMRPPAAPTRPARQPRQSTAASLAALVTLALLSAFFAWVTAEPVWLALGHETAGTLTVTRCVDHGLNRRCAGTFTSADGRFTRASVPVMGDVPAVGTAAPARMTSDRGARVYVDVDAGGRAALGVLLVVLCALAIVRSTGVRRLPTSRMRAVATAISVAGPLTLLAAMLTTTH